MTSRRTIRLHIAYDGTDFSGWQRQRKERTVQGVLEDALRRIHKEPVNLTGSGRTDAGVHAVGQVAHFYTGIAGMGAERFVPALNSLLPQDVRVLESRETPPGFHARFDAKARTYRYHFICGRSALPHELRYALQLWRRPRLDLLNDYCRFLRGEIDCTVFAVPGDPSKSRSRHISGACFFIQGDKLVFEIRANAFLWKMVRSIAGTLLHCEERAVPPEAFNGILHSGDRNRAGPTLPPQGLFLWKIDYYQINRLVQNPGWFPDRSCTAG
ncbi:MAG: tRNA pseudouridine(38-40) synthase TruA [Treponema sp.]|jgi:tRNA pseudouridine38-40 synthase|nr:tRNA pseudouridine(38-40) synthase TruA [Treponema sp.]